MLRIGLTGGIGSGKSTVARRFATHGITVIDADEIVHALSQPGETTLEAIVARFGPRSLTSDGHLDRDWLRQHVFANPEERRALEGILHPAVRAAMQAAASAASGPYCVLVIPLLLETGFTDLVDRILMVMAPREMRIARVAARSRLDRAQVEAIMASQASDEQRLAAADDVIDNDGDLSETDARVDALDRRYRELAAAGAGNR